MSIRVGGGNVRPPDVTHNDQRVYSTVEADGTMQAIDHVTQVAANRLLCTHWQCEEIVNIVVKYSFSSRALYARMQHVKAEGQHSAHRCC